MSLTYEPNTERLLAALRVAVMRDHRKRVRRRRALAAASLALMTTGVALGARQDWWVDAAPATDPAVVEPQLEYRDLAGQPQQLADPAKARTVATAPGLILNAAPTEKGGYCLLPHVTRKPGDSAIGAALGLSCGFAPSRGGLAASTFGTIATDAGGVARFYVYGRMTQPRAQTVDLSRAAGKDFRVALAADGFFAALVPEALWSRLRDERAEVAVLAADGSVIREACVLFGASPRSEDQSTMKILGRLGRRDCDERP